MNRPVWKSLVGLLWLALPVVALRHWLAWDQLPGRMATHFDAAGNPNGWMSRQEAFVFSLVAIGLLLAIATVVLTRVRQPNPAAWALLAVFYVITGTLTYVEFAIVDYNLSGRSVPMLPAMIPALLAVVVAVAIAIAARRSGGLPIAGSVTEEVHASPVLGAVFFFSTVAQFVAAFVVRIRAAQVGLWASGIVFLLTATAAWSGFHYFFSEAGVEIRTLGFRLQSIPAGQIRQYAAGRWRPLYGYGIRGLGSKRGYVWGNRGVRIYTGDGEVFLGHDQPERIVHDLDVIKQFVR